jgi:hypothetical protein
VDIQGIYRYLVIMSTRRETMTNESPEETVRREMAVAIARGCDSDSVKALREAVEAFIMENRIVAEESGAYNEQGRGSKEPSPFSQH